MTEEEYSWIWHSMMLENKFLQIDGDAFEHLFQILAKARWRENFTPTIPMGRRGDLKCDGFRSDVGGCYQCYGPRYGQVDVDSAISKINQDFKAAKDHWRDQLKNWTFVVGVYKDKVPSELIREIGAISSQISIPAEIMTREDIIQFSKEIPIDDRNRIIGLAPTPADLTRRVTFKNIGHALAYIRAEVRASPIEVIQLAPDMELKLRYNLFDEITKAFIRMGRTAAERVQEYLLTYIEPSEAEEMAEGFTRRYKDVVLTGADPSEAFKEMILFAGGATGDPNRDSAALAIVAHFFVTCEIFKQPSASFR